MILTDLAGLFPLKVKVSFFSHKQWKIVDFYFFFSTTNRTIGY